MAKCFYLLNLACKHMGYLLFFMHFNTYWRYSLIILMVTFFFWPRHATYGILVPRLRMKPAPSAVETEPLDDQGSSGVPLFLKM